jgi:CheY-like chemotaxis protein
VERLVAQRTAALSAANLMLTAEIARRQEAQAALRDARDGLEQKVEERAAGLLRANKSLEQAVAAKEKAQSQLERTNAQLQVALEEVKRGHRAAIEQERMQAMGQMASGIAHDFNNALSQILGFTELLLARPEDLADRQKAVRFLEFIHAAATHAAEVVRRMRGFYRCDDGDRTEVFHFAEPARPTGPGQGRRVLLVDDDAMVGEVLEEFLRSAGHDVVTVHSGQDALNALDRGGFDVVITDRSMPDMNGDELAQAVKERSPGQPVIMVTGFGDLMADAGEQPSAVDLLVPKPVSMEKLRQAVLEVTAPQARREDAATAPAAGG